MKEAIDLVDEIRRIQPSSRVLFTTYKYNQSFFEKYVYSRFRGKSLPLVLMDYYEYQSVLRDFGKSTLAGTRYLIDSIRLENGTFHPKVIVACSDKEIKLIIGSANLTHPGFSKNAEICSIETIPYEKRHEFPVLLDVCNFLGILKNKVLSCRFREGLEALIEKIDLENKSASTKGQRIRLLHTLKEPLLDQVRDAIEDQVIKVRVLSPFFSQGTALYQKTADDFSDKIDIILQPGNNNLPVSALGSWNHVDRLNLSAITFKDNRDLHGKAILFYTESEAFGLIGSANFTENALMRSSETGGNVETSLLIRGSPEQFDYLFDSNLLSIRKSSLNEAKPIANSYTSKPMSDFRILDANVVGDKLALTFDYKSPTGTFKVKVNVNNFEREISIDNISGNTLSIPLLPEDLQALTASSIVTMSIEEGQQEHSSDLRLIHNPLYFPDQFSALNSIADEDERTWLFKILSRYAALPNLSFVMPFIERLESYGFFDLDPARKEEILWLLQTQMLNIKPYSAPEQFTNLIDRLKHRHETRMANAMKTKRADHIPIIISSFVMINKLCIWLVKKEYQKVDYLRWVRLNIEQLVLKKYFNLEDLDQQKMLVGNKILAYVVILSYIVDFYQRKEPRFRGIGRNYEKEYFDRTFVSAIQLLQQLGLDTLKADLQSLMQEFVDLSPEIDYSVPVILSSINEIIKKINLYYQVACPLFDF